MERKRRRGTVILIIVFIVGVAVMLYPSIADLWNTHFQKSLVSTYQQDADALALNEADYGYELEKARAYNDELWPTSEPEELAFLDEDEPSPDYMDCLNISGDGIMAYVDIPKLDVELPIYHTADGDTMSKGAGHLEGTSLPIGGESTHSVIAAHRGLPGAELFTNLNQMDIGDHFFIHVLNETLAYEVDQIKVVEPTDVSDLVIIEGQDLCTLLTCTPYGVNTDRLLVRGHRVPYEEAVLAGEEEGPVMKLEYWLLLAGIAVAAVGISILLNNRRKRKKGSI